jgi:hypothetical protein
MADSEEGGLVGEVVGCEDAVGGEVEGEEEKLWEAGDEGEGCVRHWEVEDGVG